MGFLKTGIETQAFEWDFAKDGGTIGTINMGIYIPKNAIAVGFWYSAKTAIAGATATVSFGTRTLDLASPTTAGTALATAATGTALVVNTPNRGVDLDATPLYMTNPMAVVMLIGTANITAGKISGFIHYQLLDY